MTDLSREEVIERVQAAQDEVCGGFDLCAQPPGACSCEIAALAALRLDRIPDEPPAPWSVCLAPYTVLAVHHDARGGLTVTANDSEVQGVSAVAARAMAAALNAHADHIDPPKETT